MESSSTIEDFSISGAMRVAAIVTSITAGAFLGSGWLIKAIGSTDASGTVAIAMTATGGLLSSLFALVKWILNEFGES